MKVCWQLPIRSPIFSQLQDEFAEKGAWCDNGPDVHEAESCFYISMHLLFAQMGKKT